MGYPDMMRDILAQTRRETIASRRRALENKPIIDLPTGLFNLTYFELRLDEEMARSGLYGNRLSLVLIDTGLSRSDDCENKNRSDAESMKIVAGVIDDCLKDTIGLAFLVGHGKIAIILPEAGREQASLTVDNVRKAILREKLSSVILRAGIAQYKDHESIEELIQTADAVLCENND